MHRVGKKGRHGGLPLRVIPNPVGAKPRVRPSPLCSPFSSVFALLLCVRPSPLCSPFSSVFALLLCVRPSPLCSPFSSVFALFTFYKPLANEVDSSL